ncbi:hypothetical protein [Streptomyces antimycoticus]|uniref:hypothetical protein n=1 Tax=Streptomyces antimycoticus TaxID=68175 RepID=UPI000A39F26F|nr:hypothetical protein [Streptomyces antimycoticus]
MGTCVFCGAEPERRHPGHSTQETTQLHDAVQAESAKSTTLLTELLPTITDLSTQFDELRNNREALLRQADRLDADITTAEDQLSPLRTHMDELLAARSAVERELELHSHINEMQERRSKLDSEGAAKVARPAEHIPTRVLNAL